MQGWDWHQEMDTNIISYPPDPPKNGLWRRIIRRLRGTR